MGHGLDIAGLESLHCKYVECLLNLTAQHKLFTWHLQISFDLTVTPLIVLNAFFNLNFAHLSTTSQILETNSFLGWSCSKSNAKIYCSLLESQL